MRNNYNIITKDCYYDELERRINKLLNYYVKNIEDKFLKYELLDIYNRYRDDVIKKQTEERQRKFYYFYQDEDDIEDMMNYD